MESFSFAYLLYLPLTLGVFAVYSIRKRNEHRRNSALQQQAREQGLNQPASLHPIIDPSLCLGCGTCASACPEKNVLGLIHGKAELLNAANCIGHGACKEACPVDAITLVLGTEERGIDIPRLGPDFQTNVEGIFVAGELGGMGLIRNGIEQGRQAIDAIRQLPGIGSEDRLDVLIIGAGPAGFSASLAAESHGLCWATLDQETLGGTVSHYPRGKIVMTAPVDLALYGKVKLRETTKEALLELWQAVVEKTGISISYEERVEAISDRGGEFEVTSDKQSYRARAVLLAIGRRGTPRKLDVPGEEESKVVYRLIDPEQYAGERVLVVGGGDSALEAAIALAEMPDTKVALSYRSASFSRAKAKNREKVEAAEKSGKLRVLLSSTVSEIRKDVVILEAAGGTEEIDNDAVIVCAGGVLPTAFLQSVGISIETKHGTA